MDDIVIEKQQLQNPNSYLCNSDTDIGFNVSTESILAVSINSILCACYEIIQWTKWMLNARKHCVFV